MFEGGLEECPCKRKKCERHSKCDECLEHHKENAHKGLPYCKQKKKKKLDTEKVNTQKLNTEKLNTEKLNTEKLNAQKLNTQKH